MKCAFIDLGKHYGGAENYLITIIKGWIQEGNQAIVIARKESLFESAIKNLGMDVQVYSVKYSIADFIKTNRIIRKNEIDVVNINGINSGIFINLARIKAPFVTTVHSNAFVDRVDKTKVIRKIFVSLENFCLKKSKKIIVVSIAIKNLLVERGIDESKIIVIHNGVKKIEYENRKYRESIETSLKVCFMGRLEKVKGCEYLIKALAEVRTLNITCDVFGEGSRKNELKNLIESLHLEDKVLMKGHTTKARQLLPYYDVVVLPSLYEAFPLTIPEAMNAKTLIVCSNIGGIPFIIRDRENGFLFESENYIHLAEILKMLFLNPLLQSSISKKAYEDFINYYTEEQMTKKTLRIFSETSLN